MPKNIDETENLSTISGLSKELSRIIGALKPIAKALEKIEKEDDLMRQDYLSDAVTALKSMDLGPLGLAESQKEIIRDFENRLHGLRANARQNLMTGLESYFQKDEIKIFSDNPLTLYLHPLTLTVDFEHASADFSYARQSIQTVALDPKEIRDARLAIVENFKAMRVDSKTFFKRIHTAYQMLLLKEERRDGERVQIVDLIEPISWLWADSSNKKSSRSQIPKYLLAYQIQKLRNDKLLEYQGIRMDLGAATGGTTRNKNNVIYIPHSQSEGQYYLSICFNHTHP